ncbi:hypothetical protein ACTMU2_33550 [Cupriavidus basilensis]
MVDIGKSAYSVAGGRMEHRHAGTAGRVHERGQHGHPGRQH